MKNWICDRTLVTTRIIAAFLGLIAIGSTSFADAAPQQQISSINSASLDTGSQKNYINNSEENSTIVALSEKVQVSLENSVNAPEKIPLQQGMPYKEARHINSGCAGMISNPRFILGRKVESSCQQISAQFSVF